MAQTIKLKRSATQGAVPTTSNLALGELAINTYDGKIFIKKNDGSESIVTIGALADNAVTSAKIAANAVTSSEVAANAIGTSEIAANSVGISELNVSDGSDGQVLTTNGSGTLSFTSKSASAQSFYLNTATGDGNTTGFTLSTTPASESYIIAFIDGVFQNQDSYTFSGTTLTFDTAPANGTTVTVYVVGSIYSGNSVVLDTFSGDDLETAFTLSEDPQSENNTQVYIDGVYQQKSEYSVSGQTITFSSAPPTGTNNIEVIAFTSTNLTVLNANSVTSASIASGAVNTSDIADNAITSAKIASGVIVASDVADNSITSAKIALNAVGASELASGALNGQTFTGDSEITGEFTANEFIGDLRGAVLFKAQAGENVSKGDVVYISGISGNTTVVSKADADDASKMPAFGIVAATTTSGQPVDIYTQGILSDLDTSAYSEGDELFVSTTAGALTDTAPTGETALLQKIAKVTRSNNLSGSIFITGAGRTNAVPNLDEDQFFLGNASNQAVATDFSNAVEALSINNVVEDTTPQLGGDLASNGNDILFADNDKAIFGTGSDLQIYHDGTHSYLDDQGTGDLRIKTNFFRVRNSGDTSNMIIADQTGAVTLYHNGNTKLATTSTGIDVTGEVLADSLDIDGNGDISGNLTLGGYLAGPSTFTIDPAAVGDNTGTVVIAGNFQVDGTTTTVNSTTITVDDKLLTLASGSINAAAADGGGIEIDITGSTNPSILYDGTNDEWDFNKDINVTGTVIANGLTVDTNTLYVDSTNNRIGVGTTSPISEIHVVDAVASAGIRLESSDTGNSFIAFDDQSASNQSRIYYNHSTDSLQFTVNGDSERMRIDSSGNVGIGTTSPTEELTIKATDPRISLEDSNSVATGTTGLIEFDGTDTRLGYMGAVSGDLYMFTDSGTNGEIIFSTNNSEAARIDSSGNVGIGTDSPSSELHVYNNGTSSQFRVQNNDGTAKFQKYQDDLYITNDDTGDILFNVSDSETEAMRINASGNVGIGTSSPSSPLTINRTADGDCIEFETGGVIVSKIGTVAGRGLVFDADPVPGGATATTMQFRVDNSEAMRIDSSGNVGIGTDDPLHKLHVLDGDIGIQNTSGKRYRLISESNGGFTIRDQNAAQNRIHIDTSGDIGIGTSSPESILHIDAGDSANLLIKSDGTYNIQLSNKTTANGLRPIDIEAQQLTISTNGAGGSGSTERVLIDDSGTINIATQGGTWGGFTGKIENYLSSWANFGNSGTLFAHNARYDGTNYVALGTGTASRIWMNSVGQLLFETANSATAGSAVTYQNLMTLKKDSPNYQEVMEISSADRTLSTGQGPGIVFKGKVNTDGTTTQLAQIVGFRDDTTNGYTSGGLSFYTRAVYTNPMVERIRIDEGGGIAINGINDLRADEAVVIGNNNSYGANQKAHLKVRDDIGKAAVDNGFSIFSVSKNITANTSTNIIRFQNREGAGVGHFYYGYSASGKGRVKIDKVAFTYGEHTLTNEIDKTRGSETLGLSISSSGDTHTVSVLANQSVNVTLTLLINSCGVSSTTHATNIDKL